MSMNNRDFADLLKARRLEEDILLSIKGYDYARVDTDDAFGDVNRLRNFEVIAGLLGGAPMDAITVCAVYWLKHVLALCTYIATRRLESEPLASRFTDLQNYGYLLEANIRAASDGADEEDALDAAEPPGAEAPIVSKSDGLFTHHAQAILDALLDWRLGEDILRRNKGVQS